MTPGRAYGLAAGGRADAPRPGSGSARHRPGVQATQGPRLPDPNRPRSSGAGRGGRGGAGPGYRRSGRSAAGDAPPGGLSPVRDRGGRSSSAAAPGSRPLRRSAARLARHRDRNRGRSSAPIRRPETVGRGAIPPRQVKEPDACPPVRGGEASRDRSRDRRASANERAVTRSSS